MLRGRSPKEITVLEIIQIPILGASMWRVWGRGFGALFLGNLEQICNFAAAGGAGAFF